mmetsp:Transcript_2142/g.7679  ORF Transcript_2142/g.7679 Transcript_2142/m.7679 type:complete len:270 (-) Transcript_2142:5255-6064(-)
MEKKSVEGSSDCQKTVVEELRLTKRKRQRNRRKHAPRSKSSNLRSQKRTNKSLKTSAPEIGVSGCVLKTSNAKTTSTGFVVVEEQKRRQIKQLVPEKLDYFSSLVSGNDVNDERATLKSFAYVLKQKAPSSSYRKFILKKLVPKLAKVGCTGYGKRKNTTRSKEDIIIRSTKCGYLPEKWTSSPWRKPLTWRRKDWRQGFVSITPRRRRCSRTRFSSSFEKVRKTEANSPSHRLWRRRERFWGRDKSYPALRRYAGKSKLKGRLRTERN